MQTTINMSDMSQEEPVPPAPEHIPTPEATPTQQEEGTPTIDTFDVDAATSDIAALAPVEEEVIDGEVTAIIEPDHKPTPKQPPYYLIVVGTILACFLYLAVSLLLPLLTPSATVLIIPLSRSITATTVIQVHGRVLPTLTLSQSQTTPATGKRHQDATEAQGTIIFYNGQLSEVTIAAGTILTGNDGVQVITDQLAVIPAANLPYVGQVTVRAHVLDTGRQGNIQAYDINQACCVTAVKAVNTTAFTGGQSAREYIVVSKGDINNAVTSLLVTLSQVETAALQAQLHTGEALIPIHCTPHVSTDHKAGEEAKHVSVSVSVACGGIAYSAHEVDQDARNSITSKSQTLLGTNDSIPGDTQVTITRATITNQAQGIATLTVKIDATVIYRITSSEKEQMKKLIAGKTPKLAQAILLHLPAVAGAVITIKGNTLFTMSDTATLPDNPGSITILVVQRV